ncbi:MAG: DUF6259 domain-containing protein [Caldicoprobacterales bacterium]|jgi:hypothetical protein|nr:hypothetical protein [Clostridiales bacterium]
MDTFKIKSSTVELTFEKQYGNLVGMSVLDNEWSVLDRPHLGRNWELLIPLKTRRNNPVHGYKQRLHSLRVSEDGRKAEMSWKDLTSEYGGVHDVQVFITVEAVGEAIVWRTRVVNNEEDSVVENVCSPIVGDLRPDDSGAISTFFEGYSNPTTINVLPNFTNNKGYWGIDIPSLVLNGTPANTPYFLIRSEDDRGIYLAPYQNLGQLMLLRFRLYPGFVTDDTGEVPKGDFISGKEVFLPFDLVHLPFIQSGESMDLTPVHIEAYKGDWKKGVDVYRRQRDNLWQWKKPAAAKWVKRPHSWLQLHINSPEDELRMRFTELPKVAEECRKYGISAIQLVGWNKGGQDQGNPSHDPDPRLGTFDELKEAIARCHEIGVKVILFYKFTWADTSTEWFKNELYKYAATDFNGNYYPHGGYQYQTMTQLADVNTKRFVSMCTLSEELRKIYLNEFKKAVDLGAAGVLIDESQHHGSANLCFNESHGHRKGEYIYSADNQFIKELREIAPDDFLISGECSYDMQFQEFDMSYFRVGSRDAIPLKRYTRPKNTPLYMIAVIGFDDREVLNKCLMCNYVVSYEPYFFKGKPSDFPLTMEYGMQMQQLREETSEYTWYGEFMERDGAKVYDSEGKPYEYYSVFKSDEGNLAVVITNFNQNDPLTVSAELSTGRVSRWKAVGGEWVTDSSIIVPPRTAVVAVEK